MTSAKHDGDDALCDATPGPHSCPGPVASAPRRLRAFRVYWPPSAASLSAHQGELSDVSQPDSESSYRRGPTEAGGRGRMAETGSERASDAAPRPPPRLRLADGAAARTVTRGRCHEAAQTGRGE
eukprot:2863464-Rhodomonas_salina.1